MNVLTTALLLPCPSALNAPDVASGHWRSPVSGRWVTVSVIGYKTCYFEKKAYIRSEFPKSEKKKTIGMRVKQHLANSILRLPALSTQLCEPVNIPTSGFSSTMLKVFERTDISNIEKAVIELQYLYALRINEVLNIDYYNIFPAGQILIKSEKGSNNRIVIPVLFRETWFGKTRTDLPLSRIYNRFYFYRLYKRLGFYAKYKDNSNYSVTHFFRHELIEQLQKSGMTKEDIQLFTAHKSTGGLASYVK